MKNNHSISDLKFNLQQQYKLVCFEDLADYHSQHGSIFDLFQRCYQSEFGPQQRLVLYTSYHPSQEFLNHIQYAAKTVDISNFFVVIVTPFDLTANLALSTQLHGNDSQPIQSLQIELESTQPLGSAGFFTNRNTICPLPFTSVDVTKTDVVRPCCKFKGSMGDINNSTLKEIFDSQAFESVRQQLASGQQIPECQSCWTDEQHNTTSLRLHALNKFNQKFEQQYFDQPAITNVSLSPSNLCNFSCRICDYRSSSKIAAEEFSHCNDNEQKTVFRHYLNLEKNNVNQQLIDNAVSSLSNAEFLHVLGGEPFIWPLLPDFLDRIIEHGYAPQMQLEFNTNASTFPLNLLEHFKKFKSVEILLSIDDVGSRFELQRGGNWASVEQNLLLFSRVDTPNINVKVAPTVNIQNILYLDELVSLCNTFNFDIVWCYLQHPPHLSIDSLTAEAKKLVHKKFQHHQNSELKAIAQRVISSTAVSGKEFLDYTNKLDQRRKQKFEFAHKEIFEAMSS
jgi:MoaA/NifB/PqqE/SkfB family radical SAM enzyme